MDKGQDSDFFRQDFIDQAIGINDQLSHVGIADFWNDPTHLGKQFEIF
ncbi:MAG TPA: hypothetical protein VJ044_06090 [Candidatus Hodarchaeales archaeon]|nr:hypothetical protein [Candidatus Hodarchaeales archaeon]